ncbi:MAG: Mov34/MPN/PAD-1 family protein [Planctomycetota bacterium]|jgi:proteasome lid subunit RPN8/RPN11
MTAEDSTTGAAPEPEGISFADVQVKPPAALEWPLDGPGSRGWRMQPKGPAAEEQVPVVVDEPVLAEATAYVSQDLSRESGGVLCGRYGIDMARDFVLVTHFIPAPDAKGGAAHLTFTHEAFAACEKQREAIDPELVVVGWVHSHPGYGIFLSDADQFLHTQFFNLPWQVALVIDPKRSELGFFRDDGAGLRGIGFHLRTPAGT